MSAVTTQVQLKISLSEQLNDLLESKAARLGVPVTQFVKHLILKEVDKNEFPVFAASKQVEKNTKQALKDYDKAVHASDFLNSLDES